MNYKLLNSNYVVIKDLEVFIYVINYLKDGADNEEFGYTEAGNNQIKKYSNDFHMSELISVLLGLTGSTCNIGRFRF